MIYESCPYGYGPCGKRPFCCSTGVIRLAPLPASTDKDNNNE